MFQSFRLRRCVGRFFGDRAGNVVVLTAIALPVLLGMAGLAVEYGNALLVRVENQRTADMAAYAGAVAYSVKQTDTAMRSAALSVGALNNIASTDMTVTLVDSPRTSGNKAVNVTISSARDLFLSKILSNIPRITVNTNSFAELGSGQVQPGCVLALDPADTGVTLSGGTKISAPTCVVSSNAAVTVPCGTKITALGVTYNSAAAPSQPCAGISATTITKQATPDPLSGNTAVTGAAARLTTVAAVKPAAAPVVSTGTDVTFGYGLSPTQAQVKAAGCTATSIGNDYSGNWKVNCPGGTKTFTFGAITVGGGVKVDFNSDGPSTTTYNFAGLVTNMGTSLAFGPGTFNMAKGLFTMGGAPTSFGAGTFRIGQMASNCNGGYVYSICNLSSGALTFAGPSVFELSAGFYNNGGSTLVLGSGTTNSFKIGASTGGDSIVIGGGSKTTLADVSGSSNVFELSGDIDGGGGGSCFVVSAAAQHDIKGSFAASGAIALGAGIYTVDGYLAFGSAGGGSASCNGSTISVKGTDVSFVISGKTTPNSGTCYLQAFCVAAGYSDINLAAPTSGTMAKLLVIGPQSVTNNRGATFAEGGSNGILSGAFYFPYGPVTLSGGAGISGSASYCLQLIGSRISLSGGTQATSECIAASGANSKKNVVLVQ